MSLCCQLTSPRLIGHPGFTGQSEPCRERRWGWTHTSTQREEVRRRRLCLPRRPGTWRSASARVESRRTAWRAAVRLAAARRGCCSPSLQRHRGKRGHRYTHLNQTAYTDGRNNSHILHLSGQKCAHYLIQNQSVNAFRLSPLHSEFAAKKQHKMFQMQTYYIT